jgi:hypothetical protein
MLKAQIVARDGTGKTYLAVGVGSSASFRYVWVTVTLQETGRLL